MLLYPRFEEEGGILVYPCPSVRPSVTNIFVTYFSATTIHSHFIFGIQLHYEVPYRAYRFQVCRTSTSCFLTYLTIMPKGPIFRKIFFSNFLSQSLDIWYGTLVWGPILWDSISDLSGICFLFADLGHFSTIMTDGKHFSTIMTDGKIFVRVFSVTTYHSLLS